MGACDKLSKLFADLVSQLGKLCLPTYRTYPRHDEYELGDVA